MKIRNGFVSNSSSSSFILFKTYLSSDQVKCIRNWNTYALSDKYKEKVAEYNKNNDHPEHTSEWFERLIKKETFEDFKIINKDATEKDFIERKRQWKEEAEKAKDFSYEDYSYYPEGWSVEETSDIFNIHTSMDNFDMIHYLRVNGIDIDKCGMELLDEHYYTVGLNDAKTDLKEYFSNDNYWADYDEYFKNSKFYKENIGE